MKWKTIQVFRISRFSGWTKRKNWRINRHHSQMNSAQIKLAWLSFQYSPIISEITVHAAAPVKKHFAIRKVANRNFSLNYFQLQSIRWVFAFHAIDRSSRQLKGFASFDNILGFSVKNWWNEMWNKTPSFSLCSIKKSISAGNSI